MFLEFTPVTLDHSPAEEAESLELATLPARMARPLNALVLIALAAGGGYEATQYVCDKLTPSAAAATVEPPLIRTVVHEQRTRETLAPSAKAPVAKPRAAVGGTAPLSRDVAVQERHARSLAAAAATPREQPNAAPLATPPYSREAGPQATLAAHAFSAAPREQANAAPLAAVGGTPPYSREAGEPERLAARSVAAARAASHVAMHTAAAAIEPSGRASTAMPVRSTADHATAANAESRRALAEEAGALPDAHAIGASAEAARSIAAHATDPSAERRRAQAELAVAAVERTREEASPSDAPAREQALATEAPARAPAAAEPHRPGEPISSAQLATGALPGAPVELPAEHRPAPAAPAAAPRPVTPPPAAAPPPAKPTESKPVIQLVRVHGALTNRRALRGITRVEPLLAACWNGLSDASAWNLTSTIDAHGRARTTQLAAIGGAHANELGPCIERAAHQLRVEAPDTGGAVIEWSVTASR